jgi:hypothetical protein
MRAFEGALLALALAFLPRAAIGDHLVTNHASHVMARTLEHFLRTGEVMALCDGPCDPE